MKVVATAIYPPRAAATRLRVLPVLDGLTSRGVTTELATFLTDNNLDRWVSGGASRIMPALGGIHRLRQTYRETSSCDVLLVQREALPLNLLLAERHGERQKAAIIWDVDDALWDLAGPHARIRGSVAKYQWLARRSAEVWAGNRTVAAWAEDAGAREVLWVPTCVPVPRDFERSEEEDLLVWVGTPSTGSSIEALLHSLADSLSEWRVLIVGATVTPPNGVRVQQLPWSPESEASALRRAAIGLYPLDTTQPSTAGKSALKAVLFMAHGIPIIATPTANNRDVMTHEREGFFADSTEEWRTALGRLRVRATRQTMGAKGRETARQRFDTDVWGPRLAKRIISVFQNSLNRSIHG